MPIAGCSKLARYSTSPWHCPVWKTQKPRTRAERCGFKHFSSFGTNVSHSEFRIIGPATRCTATRVYALQAADTVFVADKDNYICFSTLATQVYALQVADTVLVADKDKHPEVATHHAPKTLDKVSYNLKVCVR